MASSRLCVKGLPKTMNGDRLRELFSQQGEVTDAKVMRTQDGTSRQFGFVGFHTPSQAEAARKYFNRSFIDTSRIIVEIAEKVGSDQLARPWSKHSEGSSASKRLQAQHQAHAGQPQLTAREAHKAKQQKHGRQDTSVDPKLAEFLDLMKPRRAGKLWTDEGAPASGAAEQGIVPAAAAPHKQSGRKRKAQGLEEKASEAATVPTPELQGQPAQAERKSRRRQAVAGAAVRHAAVASEASSSDSEDEGLDDEGQPAQEDGTSDLDYLRSRMRKDFDDAAVDETEGDEDDAFAGAGVTTPAVEDASASDASQGNSDIEPDLHEEHRAAPSSQPTVAEHAADADGDAEDAAAATGRLFLRNLPFTVSEAELSELFSEYGALQEVHLVQDRLTRRPRGTAFIQFARAQDADAARAAQDGTILHGRLLHVIPARPQPQAPQPVQEASGQASMGSSFKDQREAERRAAAGDRAAWSTLFMRADTVAAAVAEHYGVSKGQLLDREAADLPVRMALGETHVIAMTKRALGDAGVSVPALEAAAAASGKASAAAAVPRSSTVLLVKNLPYTASEGELSELFARSGALVRLVLPSTKAMALVEYAEPQDARRAFKALAYKRYQHVPIYLEWAPEGIFKADAPRLGQRSHAAASGQAAATGDGAAAELSAAAPEGEQAELSTIYVKNLAFATDDAGLRKHFDAPVSTAGSTVRSAKVATRTGAAGQVLSMGFGFVECSSEAVAKRVIKQLQGSMLDEHKLVLQLSARKAQPAASKVASKQDAAAKASTKLIVRNIAFEATRKDVRALFSPFGNIKTCRLPKKFDGTPRGFAFLEFTTKHEARNAMDSVGGAHLYGRRLNIEWAQAGEEGLDDIRAKTAAKFRGQGAADFDALPGAAGKQPKRFM